MTTLGKPSSTAAGGAAGVDLSGYQSNVDWTAVAKAGIQFVFVKASEGNTLVDHRFDEHWSQAKSVRLLRGAYHFFRPKVNPLSQAKFFLDQLADPGELPPALDVEVLDGVAPALVLAGVNIWLDTVSARLGRAIVYTSPEFWKELPSGSGIASRADLWVAHWGTPAPAAVPGWSAWKLWQHTNRGTVSGFPGTENIDQNRFNGSLAELQAYSAAFLAARGRPAPTAFKLSSTRGVQQALNFLALAQPPLVEDGVAGPKTKDAIERFQRSAGLSVDGIVGPNTIVALQAALQEPGLPAQNTPGGIA